LPFVKKIEPLKTTNWATLLANRILRGVEAH